MRIAAYDTICPSAPFAGLPLVIEQRSARLPAAMQLVPLAILLVLMAIPFALILELIAGEPSARAMIADRPLATAQMTIGMLLWMALLAWPARRLLCKLFTTRTVALDAHTVTVTDRWLLGSRTRIAPVAAFDGLAHHVRASLSGTRHELILAHADRSRSVLIAVADRFTKSDVERACHLLGVREIPARELYETRLPETEIEAPALAAAA
jgi:hypothetical protein